MKKIILPIVLIASVCGISYLFKDEIFKLFSNSNSTIKIFAFKEDADDRWGIIDFKGKIILEKEWVNEPSPVVEGIVRVKNKEGLYEYFTAEEKPKKIGKEYKDGTLFNEGMAAVVEEDEPIRFIDKKGELVFTLKELDGKNIKSVSCFSEGLVRFQDSDNKWGYIDNTGKVLIKAKYDFADDFKDGIARVGIMEKTLGKTENKKLSEAVNNLSNQNSENINPNKNEKNYQNEILSYGFINKNGEEIIPLKKDIKYSQQSEGLIPYSDDGENYGLINFENEKLLKPDKDFKNILPFHQGYASFNDGDKWGIIDTKGQVIIRPKYSFTFYSNNLVLIEDDNKVGFINLDGEEIIKPKYDEGIPFFNSTTIVKEGNSYILIDKKGNEVIKNDFKEIGGLQNIFLLNIIGQNQTIESDFYIKELLKENTKKISRKWSFGEMQSPAIDRMLSDADTDSKKYYLDAIEAMKSNSFIEFKADGTYQTSMGGTNTFGKWNIDYEAKNLNTEDSNGKSDDFLIGELTYEKLILNTSKDSTSISFYSIK